MKSPDHRILPAITLVAMLVFAASCFAAVPKKGEEKCVSGKEVVNRYSVLAAIASIGSSSIAVSDIASLSPIASGDLLLLHEATDDPSTDKTEVVVVQSISGSTIHLRDHLQHEYSNISAVQVVYVPQYATLTVPDGSSIIAGSSRNGFAGIVAIRVSGSVVINGTISARMAQPQNGDDEGADAEKTSTNGLILLLVPSISGHGTIHAYSGKSFDLDSDDCGSGDCDGVVVVGGKTSLSGITIHAKSILFAGITGRR